MRTFRRFFAIALSCLVALVLWPAITPPAQAHWADQAAAQVWISPPEDRASVQIDLTFPTGLAEFADRDRNNQLSVEEIRSQSAQLQALFQEKIRLSDSARRPGTLTVSPLGQGQLPPTLKAAPDTHTTLRLTYRWPQPVETLNLQYDLFLLGVPTASCLTTLLQEGNIQTFVFTPQRRSLSVAPGLLGRLGSMGSGLGGLALALATAFVWGALHSLSPGHGKTIVGAYLVGERATPKHALFLALATTVTHTLAVFALGLVALLAANFVLPETLYPWLGLISGLMVVSIGANLLSQRLKRSLPLSQMRFLAQLKRPGSLRRPALVLAASAAGETQPLEGKLQPSSPGSAHPAHGHSHDHSHLPRHNHGHEQGHSHAFKHRHGHEHGHEHLAHGHRHEHRHSHGHSHLPPGADGALVTWRNLLALGISGGLVPCPAALVLMLSAIALGKVGTGLLLVLAFSLGLAGVLMGLGLLLVGARQLFTRLPSGHLPLLSGLPVASAAVILLIGMGISAQAALQLLQVT